MVKALKKIWLDGRLVDWEDANVHVLTHSLHYGYAAFEGIRAYERADGRSHVFRHREHLKRLFETCHILMLDVPYSFEQLRLAVKETLKANELKSGYVRPLVFMGDGPMGLGALDNAIRVAIITWEWGAYLGEEGLRQGIRAKISSYTRHHVNVSMVKGKITGQYVNSILAKREAMKGGYQEAILLDAQGYVAEASGENLFVVNNGVIYTPQLGGSILAGITRDAIVRIATDLGHRVEQSVFTRDQLYCADEVFMSGTAAEVTPVREIDDRKVGAGTAGPITLAIQKRFFEVVKGANTDYLEWLDWVE